MAIVAQTECRTRRVEAITCDKSLDTSVRRDRGKAMIEDLDKINGITTVNAHGIVMDELMLDSLPKVKGESAFCGQIQPILQALVSGKATCVLWERKTK